ncbi:aquaporin-like protein [Cucurbitaria berberidis CBS 394.84]|uniref:Aquaporin-like protein n=1 Tax=Cucurbitaria berberidis CBS 394.84 TaxID=1168544 RepID=A0A9P4L3T5_9PLEO|nr:aquaporin-like protein [Cucurbitaria berberidis CBS 394.84]KAF1840649.1 aquaporin-like protein [Cucurbitaria berberidis CBS 394.84]
MSQPQPDGPAEQNNGTNQQPPNNSMAGRRQQTTTDFRPPRLYHNSSTASSMGRYANARVVESNQSRPGPERSHTARTNFTNQTDMTEDPNHRAERKPEQTVDVENEYFALNPWYNQQKDKPVFGLAAPLPRTVRRGMWRGKGDLRKSLYKVEEDQDNDGVARNDGLDFEKNQVDFNEDTDHLQVPLGHENETSPHGPQDPDNFRTTIRGRNVNVRRVPTDEADHVLYHRGIGRDGGERGEGGDRAPVNERGLSYSGQQGQTQHFGMQDGLPPLKELASHETSQTQKDKAEVQHREHEAQQESYNQYRNPIARLRAKYPQAPAEFLATFVYLLIGICVNLSVATSEKATGSFETQAWGWGFAVMIGIYLGGGVSGSHLSPTISISLSIYRGFPWKMAAIYICMQMLAGLCAGALAYALYRDAILAVDPGLTLDKTGKALFPKGPSFTTVGGFFNDFVYMAVYVCITFALGDDQNSPPGQGMTALIIGFTGFVTMIALGYNTGLGISPARDLGPRLVALWAGYPDAFKGGYWAYGSWGASISGAFFGGLIYDLFIFAGGESPVNYRWPQPGDIKWKVKEKRQQTKDKIQRIA